MTSAPASGVGAPAADPSSRRAPASISSATLQVQVAADFPRVVGYLHRASGKRLGGQPEAIDTVRIDGVDRAATVRRHEVTRDRATWTLAFPQLPGVQLDTSVAVAGDVVTFAVDAVRDTAAHRVHTLEVPDHDLVSVSSTQAGAATAFTTLDPDATRTADRFTPVRADTPLDAAPVGATYALVNTAGLAAGLVTNATTDQPTGAEADDGTRFWHRTRAGADGSRRVGVWTGEWTYRGATSSRTEPLPWTRIAITGDANADGSVDWQDAALAYRGAAPVANGADQVPDRVVQRIPFNFASQATHPFLRTLDDTKRIALSTDGLGQFAVLKGYGSEGHDSAHPDYGGNYNTRAGGLKDLNTLLAQGKRYNAAFGVHVNTTEAYPEARAFDEKLVDKDAKGWNWLNQSYYIDQRRDLASGDVIDRFAQLRRETDANLQALYIDVYYSSGWLADSLSRQLADQGWQISTEWSDRFERSSLWAHWANDLSYGGQTNKGLNSQIIRFIANDRKDTWNADPVLGQSALLDFEGWTGETDWNAFSRNIWTSNLPAKFAQQHQILDWDGSGADTRIRFSDGVRGTVEKGRRTFWVGNAKVLDGDRYLLPWASQGRTTPDKLYHWNPADGTSTWTLPAAFADSGSLSVYELTTTGRRLVDTMTPTNGRVTLRAKPGVAYVVYPAVAPTQRDVQWGQGSGLSNPGFDAADLAGWTVGGAASVAVLPEGHRVAELGRPASSISQRVSGLNAGATYSASAWVEVQPGATRPTTLTVEGGRGGPTSSTIERSTAQNLVASDEKHDAWYQRVRVEFTATSGTAVLRLAAAPGAARVRIDDVRVVRTTSTTEPGAVLHADFEDVDQGWWPFVKGDAGGTTDPRTSLVRRHAPFTQAGWNGKRVSDVLGDSWSLKAHEENEGLVYRTTPASVRFEEGHRYQVRFRYASGRPGSYAWVRGTDRIVDGSPVSTDLVSTPVPEQLTPATWTQSFTAGCGGDNWVGLRKLGGGGDQADFVIDDLVVRDLGPSSDAAECASVTASGPGLTGMVAGEANPVTTTLTNNGETPLSGASITLAAPDGWEVRATSPTDVARVPAGGTATVTWAVSPPADAEAGSVALDVSGAWTAAGRSGSARSSVTAVVLPAGVVPQSRITVESVSSDEPATDGAAAMAIDGDPQTLWHTAWSQVPTPATYPHEIVLDLGDVYAVDGFRYLPRQVGTNGRMKDYRLFVSQTPGSWGDPVSTGAFTDGTEETVLDFPAVTGRYVRLVGLSSQNGGVFGGAAELNVLGTRVG